MSKLTLPRLNRCHCGSVAVSRDKKCLEHTSYQNTHGYADSRYYPTPQRLGINGPAMGIEIECYPAKSNVCCLPHVDYWALDGSLSSLGREIKICDYPHKIAKKACDIINRIKASGGYVNRNCGLHVHMSFVRESQERYKVNTLMSSVERSLWNLFKDRSRGYVSDWLVHKGYTFENRAHPGTLNPHIMVAWVDVCRKIQEAITQNESLLHKWTRSGEFMYPFRSNSYAYRYLKARKNNDGRMLDESFSF